jgi:ribonuclease HII
LSEEEADKFIVKYSAWENKIEDQKDLVDKTSEELFEALKDEATIEDIKKLSQKLLIEQEKFGNMQIEKMKAMKEILDDKNYAKYLVFEDRFFKELSEMMMKRGMGQGQGGPGDGQGRGRRGF